MDLRKRQPAPALVVPDEETWLAWGGGERELRFEATNEPGRACVLLLPDRVPRELVPAVRAGWAVMATAASVVTYDAPLQGMSARAVVDDGEITSSVHGDARHEHHRERREHAGGHGAAGEDESHDAGEHDSNGGHGGHGQGDMMAITGEPSADGLVMESLDVQAGPLGVALAGGLVVGAKLDGDVVAECNVDQTLRASDDDGPSDPWASVAWNVAELAAQESQAGLAPRPGESWFRLAAVEVERALAQLAWLHQFLRLLAWPQMTDRVRPLLLGLVGARGGLLVELTTLDLPDVTATALREQLLDVQFETETLARDLAGSRLFARRTTGLGRLSRGDAAQRGVSGPVARASGISSDVRTDDRGYLSLGFAPVVGEAGDARARALARAQEAAQSAGLAAAALERAHGSADDTDVPMFSGTVGGIVESARGPVCVLADGAGRLHRTAPGARAACDAAGELAIGHEWAAALVTISSFDISPWRLGP